FVWKQNYILVDEYFFFCCTWIVNSALKAGDVVLTGTPAGVGPLLSGDELDIRFNGETLSTRVL
ncbi:hypothetical protein NBD61_23600, partial [Salmonella sp. C3293]